MSQKLIDMPESQKKIHEIYRFLVMLYDAYSIARHQNNIKQYRDIYHNFVINCHACISEQSRAIFDDRFDR